MRTNESPEKVFFLLKHLDRYYLQLSSDHEEFRITNGRHLFQGADIINQEHSGGQNVRHAYRVDQMIEGQSMRLVSNKTVVTKKVCCYEIKINLKTIVEFEIKKHETENTVLHCRISLIFPNKSSFFISTWSKTEEIWSAHLKDEMAGGKHVISSEKFTEDFNRETTSI